MSKQLDAIMKPKAIAVVGASTKEHTIGSDIMKRLQEYKFTGNIYPVNPKGGIIEGLQAYTSVTEIPGEVDLTTPKQLGPTHLIPYSRTFAKSCFSASAPSAPVSLKPAVITTRPLTPFSWHWSIVSKTNFWLTTIIAKSTSPGISVTEV